MALDNPKIPVQESWKVPTLLNAWVNYGSGFNPAGYWKDSFGVVHLRGVVTSGVIGSIIFNLPTGYRPVNTEALIALRFVTAGIEFGRVDIANTGTVVAASTVAAGGATVTFLFLDGLTFRAT